MMPRPPNERCHPCRGRDSAAPRAAVARTDTAFAAQAPALAAPKPSLLLTGTAHRRRGPGRGKRSRRAPRVTAESSFLVEAHPDRPRQCLVRAQNVAMCRLSAGIHTAKSVVARHVPAQAARA